MRGGEVGATGTSRFIIIAQRSENSGSPCCLPAHAKRLGDVDDVHEVSAPISGELSTGSAPGPEHPLCAAGSGPGLSCSFGEKGDALKLQEALPVSSQSGAWETQVRARPGLPLGVPALKRGLGSVAGNLPLAGGAGSCQGALAAAPARSSLSLSPQAQRSGAPCQHQPHRLARPAGPEACNL